MLRELTKEEMLRLQINELAGKIQELTEKRDYLVGQSVALETAGMNYPEQKAFSLGIRWYSCKDMASFKKGYRDWLTPAPAPVGVEPPQGGAGVANP